ncbi:hypothetical protein [Lentibacillus daqui]|uniref:hypothetical protein n=1 Tax=Lentibacillus daqui TaxID=2911514 RepID=UPI0022B110C4|nr:hypothetical protein [Lentibacillus daqui]
MNYQKSSSSIITTIETGTGTVAWNKKILELIYMGREGRYGDATNSLSVEGLGVKAERFTKVNGIRHKVDRERDKVDRTGHKVDRERDKVDRTGHKVDRERDKVDRERIKVDQSSIQLNEMENACHNFDINLARFKEKIENRR